MNTIKSNVLDVDLKNLDLQFEILEEKAEFLCLFNACVYASNSMICFVALEGINIVPGFIAKMPGQ